MRRNVNVTYVFSGVKVNKYSGANRNQILICNVPGGVVKFRIFRWKFTGSSMLQFIDLM